MMFRDISGSYDKWSSPEAVVVASALSKQSAVKPTAASMPPASSTPREKGSVLPYLLAFGAFLAFVGAIDLIGERLKKR